MIDINKIDLILDKYPQKTSLSEDFEAKVYSKIKIKNRQRKITYSFSIVFMLLFTLFVVQVFINNSRPLNKYANKVKTTNQKEEIPLVEDVYFSLTDSNTNYVIEQVDYSSDDGSI